MLATREKINDQSEITFNAMKYNEVGNIQTLLRKGIDNSYNAKLNMDMLSYTYLNGGNSNKLAMVSDAGEVNLGFIDGNITGDDYEYDENGNMTADKNKGITIEYNLLNLPSRISKGADYIEYTYDATGIKLSKKVYKSGVITIIDYCGETEFYNQSLKYLHTEEGLVEFQSISSFTYSYFLKDHLGNTRAVVSSESGNLLVSQIKSYYPFGMAHMGGNLGSGNKYLYNGKELQDENLGGVNLDWYDYGARFYDPQIGRWHVVDPLAEKYESWSVYQYVRNNPILRIDPTGMDDYTINKKTGDVNLVKKTDDETDRVVQTKQSGKHKGEIKTNRKGEAITAFGGVEKGILSDGINFSKNDNVIEVGGEGQASVAGVKSFTLQLSEYAGKEIKGFSYSSNASGNVTDMVLGKYINNTLTESRGSVTDLIKKYGDNFSFNSILQEFHTHPNGQLGATQSNPGLSQDVKSLQGQKPLIPNASFIILYTITGQVKPGEYDYTHEYRP